MKKLVLVAFLALCGITVARADEQVRQVQQQLKDQGFYYGNVDGDLGSETGAAIRRYQIRNGLQVTGTMTQETLSSLKIGGGAQTAAAPQTQQAAPAGTPQPRSTPKKNVTESDREFLRRQGGGATPPPAAPEDQQTQQAPPPVRDSRVVSQPVQVPAEPAEISTQYAILFRRTPYENAPMEVQQNTLRSVQLRLVRERFYDGAVDGIPGSATERAIIMFQGSYRLPQTGRLDIDTLNAMRLLPAGRHVVTEPFYPQPYYGPQRVYRGIWVR